MTGVPSNYNYKLTPLLLGCNDMKRDNGVGSWASDAAMPEVGPVTTRAPILRIVSLPPSKLVRP